MPLRHRERPPQEPRGPTQDGSTTRATWPKAVHDQGQRFYTVGAVTRLSRWLMVAVGVALAATFALFALAVSDGATLGAVLGGLGAGVAVAVGLIRYGRKAARGSGGRQP